MATKSDFAQKLLSDLRLKKERMAAAQNSSSSKPRSRGAHGNPGTALKGSKKVAALEPVGSRSANSIRKTSASTRSFHMEDSSNQIVLYEGGRNSEHRGDLPTALSFAFENGGKFSKIHASGSNPVLRFLHHISRRSVDTGRLEITSNMGKNSSTSQFPTYSHIHIHDISKGVQKLNQILRTCSNGVNFDRYSIEVGKELLRGAMDLEESLRMLVNLQEASDYMVHSQRKNKIKLLEEEEDDQSEISKANDLRIVDRPKFSFDKPRNQHCNKEAAHNGRKQQVMALTYAEETPRLQEKQPRSRSDSSSHSRSPSCIPDLKTLSTYLEPKHQTTLHSKPEKARISNVIAKLMGLEELSPKEESRATLRELSSNKKETMASMRSPMKVESKRQGQGKGQQVVDNENSISAIRTSMWDTRSMLEAENIRASPNGSSRVVISDSHWQNLEVAARKYASSGSKTTTTTAAANKKKTTKHIDAKPLKDLASSSILEHRGVHKTSLDLPTQRKHENYMKAFKRQTNEIDDTSNTRNGTSNALARSLDNESPVRQEKQMQNDKNLSSCNGEEQKTSAHFEESKAGITGLDKPEKNTDSSNAEDLSHNEPEEANFSHSGEYECQVLEVSKTQPSHENSKETVRDTHEVSEDQPRDHGETVPCDDFQFRFQEDFQNQHRGIHEECKGVRKLVQVEHKKIPAIGAAELLTESEKHLKEKLIKGQLFLNTAEALFKLNIPVSILHGNDHCGQDRETKLILDCGYELLKKKGQRQEISVYPSKDASIAFTKLRSFDDLIKQLSKDFNTLTSYGGIGSPECDTADFLSKMLEKDFQERHSDVNSMWDSSWNGSPIVFVENDEIVKDVEKHMLNGLLDEITKDLLHIAMVSA